MVKKSKIIFILFVAFILSSCANQMAPTGGEVDKIPPEVVESFPKDKTINYNDNFLEILFSEYVDKSSVQNSVFISPALKYGFEFDWSGKSVTLNIRDTLLQNTTYTVTIGTEVMDLNNRNKMLKPFVFAFSTGDKIDTARIYGKLYALKPNGVMIYAYKDIEEFNPSIQKPNYISQVGNDGTYKLIGLSSGDYKILAIRDNAQDLFYNKNEDEFGIQSKPIEIDSTNQNYLGINFILQKDDTIPPKLSSAFMKDRNHLIVEFSEPIDSTIISPQSFFLEDSVNNKIIYPKYFYKYDLKANQFYLGIEDTSSLKEFTLVANNFSDRKKNITLNDKIKFVYKTDKDTLLNKPYKVYGGVAEGKIDYDNPIVKIQFVDGIDSVSVANSVKILDAKKNLLGFSIIKIDDALFSANIEGKLKPSTEYVLNIDGNKIKDFSGRTIDSVYTFKFTTTSDLDFSGSSGFVEDNDSTDIFVTLESATGKKTKYEQKINSKNKFDFTKVNPDKYLLWAFKDKNKNGKYDPGTIKPFNYSEEFKYYSDTLNLRARWPVGDINLNFKN